MKMSQEDRELLQRKQEEERHVAFNQSFTSTQRASTTKEEEQLTSEIVKCSDIIINLFDALNDTLNEMRSSSPFNLQKQMGNLFSEQLSVKCKDKWYDLFYRGFSNNLKTLAGTERVQTS
mmetsp:Transcript_11797/g.18114  ORF Transcript_11797/g.18114 Transcript_11797/m.18114 type:complete len:120 (+) Transcript_11797:655-1014(+)